MMHHYRGLLLPVLFFLGGCSAGSAPTSLVKHDAATPTRDSAGWNWYPATDEDYAKVMAPLIGVDPTKLLPNDHPLTKRTQFWLDRIDDFVRGTYPSQLALVPKPRAKVISNSAPNAFVAPILRCIAVQVQLPKRDGADQAIDSVYLDPKSGTLQSLEQTYPCVSTTDLSIVRALLATLGPRAACSYKVTAAGTIDVGADCQVGPELATVATAKKLLFLQTSDFVSVFAPIMGIMSEPEFVAVIAHELGHYYRSHVTAAAGDYNFFYTLREHETAHKPVAEPELNSLGLEAVEASTYLDNQVGNYLKVPNQKLPSPLFFAAGTLVQKVALGATSPECGRAAAAFADPNFQARFATFPFPYAFGATLTDDLIAAYHQFESLGLACLATLTVVKDPANFAAAPIGTGPVWGLPYSDVLAAITKPTWPSWAKYLRSSSFEATAADLGAKPLPGVTLAALFTGYEDKLRREEAAARGALAEAQAKHLGQYTIEQEADDESGEWISGMGFDPETEVGTMHSLGVYIDSVTAGQPSLFSDLNTAACDALRRNHWRALDGSYEYLALGDLLDPHHSVCFREYNIERDVAAHHEVAAANKVIPTAPGESWDEIKSLANALNPPKPLVDDLTFLKTRNPVSEALKGVQCIYSQSVRL